MSRLRHSVALLVRRGLATLLSVTLVVVAVPANAQSSVAKRVQKLNVEGQDQYDNQKYEAAAASWLEALELLEEKKGTQSTRQMLAVLMADASIEAYRQSNDVSVLERARGALGSYSSNYRKTHGDEPSAEVQDALRSVDRHLSEAQAEATSAVLADVAPADVDGSEEPDAAESNDDDNGDGKATNRTGIALIAAGGTLTGLGLAGLGLMTVGMVLGSNAQNDFETAVTGFQRSQVDSRGRSANALAIAGAVAGSVLLAAGVPMVIVGALRRKKALRMALQFDRGFAGLALGGRF